MAGRRQLLHKKLADEGFALPLNLWSPSLPKYLPMQSQFVQDWDVRFRGFGGGLANGKTSGGVALAYFLSVCFPGNCGYIGRWDGKELIQTTMAEFFRLIPDSEQYDLGIAFVDLTPKTKARLSTYITRSKS